MAMTEAQIRAMQKQKQKRVGLPRLPSSYISDTENQLLIEMGKNTGQKKQLYSKGWSC
ncbi:hypothetical protein [Gilliamella apicola]|uniref:hypothetical protein n=1 Tax=Gilliamella apicola TaxID=1196095 RepID=UPI0015546D92|nr:hypothetical protein [Gilliamella apicola]